MRKVLGIIAILIAFLPVFVCAVYDLPADRVTDWSRENVGVPGGIPHRTTNCVTAACNTLWGGTVTAASIQSAIDSAPANSVVRIPAGTFTLSGAIQPKSNITVRGAGMGRSILAVSGGSAISHSTGFSSASSARAVTGGFTKGSNQVQVADTSGVQPGYLIIISQNPEPGLVFGDGGPWDDPDRPFMQIVRVESVSGSTITFSPSLHYSFSASLSPVFRTSRSAPLQFAGFEDMTIDGRNAGGNLVGLENTYAVWFLRFETLYGYNFHIHFSNSLRGEVRECNINETSSNNDGYGIGLYNACTNFLIEDNTFANNYCAVMGFGTSGSVIAYNYMEKAHRNSIPWVTPMLNINHKAHGFMNLWEGNIGSQLQNDGYHGSTSHQTIFRNRFSGIAVYDTSRKMIDLCRWSYYHNIIGNILGDPSWNPMQYEMTGEPGYTNSVIYRLGYPNMDNNRYESFDGLTDFDPRVKETLIRHGNYDYFNDAIVWDTSISDHSLPASLYYSSKPSWWGSLTWPAIGPDPNNPNVLLNGKIPAQVRFEGGSSAPACSSASNCADMPCRTKACINQQCVYSDIAPVCPAAGTVNCGVTITSTNGCGSCSGTGTRCNAGTCTNGQCIVTPPVVVGDVNGDGVVDISDLSLVAVNFGRTSGSPNFNSAIDVSVNGVIDVGDLSFVARRYTG